MRRFLTLAVLCALLPGVAHAAAPRIASLDTTGYPTVRTTVVTPKPVGTAPKLTENGRAVVGFRAVNLGREKSVMLLFDRSQSMIGQAIADASAAARQFVGSKPANDRIAVVAVGKKAVQLTSFSSNPAEADAALRTIEVDKVRGTALYDGILVSTQALAADLNPTRVLILLTDGQEVSSDASLEQAIDAARDAHVAVYPIGIESPSFRPAPLQRLAEKTGGRYVGASGTKDLKAIYAALAEELRRTWQLSYVTAARPGDRIEIDAAGVHAESVVPGVAVISRPEASRLPEQFFKIGPLAVATIVGFLGLVGGLFLMRAPAGSRLRRQINPHLGEQERKRRPRAGPGALRDGLGAPSMRRRGLSATSASGTRSTGCSNAPMFRCGQSSSSTPPPDRRSCSESPSPSQGWQRPDPRRDARRRLSADPGRLAQGAPPARRHRRAASRPPGHARRVAKGRP